jgi:hypothetical protein
MKKLSTVKKEKPQYFNLHNREEKSSSASSEYYPVVTVAPFIRGVDLYQPPKAKKTRPYFRYTDSTSG